MTKRKTAGRVLDGAQLIVLSHLLPAWGRDLLVRLGVAHPDVDQAHAVWCRLDDPRELEFILAAGANRADASRLVLVRQLWHRVTAEYWRRVAERHPVASALIRLDGDAADQAHAELLRLVRPHRRRDHEADQMAYEALEKAWASAAQTIVGVSFVAPRVDGAGIGRDVGPAPAEWETANQQTLDADIREAFRQYWPPISGELEAGRTDHLGPFVVRDAARAEREKGRAQKRSALRQVELDPDSLQSHAVELTDHAAVDAIIGSLPDAAPLRVALEAMREGATKTEAAERAGWSRPTLDAHLKELGSKHRPAD